MSLLMLEALSLVTLLVAGGLLIYVNKLTDKLTAKRAANIARKLKLNREAKKSIKKLAKRLKDFDDLDAGISAKDKHKILARDKKTTKR